MVVIARQFLYDVADPVHPRLVCRGNNTEVHLVDANAMAYTKAVGNRFFIVRRNLTTGAESQVAQLRANPNLTTIAWTSNGLLQLYTTAVQRTNGKWLVSVHLWSKGADRVLYTFESGVGDANGRWAATLMLEFSPDHAYIALSDSSFTPTSYNVRIFSVAGGRQRLVTATPGLHSLGGTWIAKDRFVWATGTGKVMQWTPTGGAALLRSEHWFGPTSSSDGRWLAGTLLTDPSKPRVLIVPAGGGKTFQTSGLASSPGFVTPTVVWYAEEGPLTDGGGIDTWPNGTVHAFDLTNESDRVVQFGAGEAPVAPGLVFCCTTRG